MQMIKSNQIVGEEAGRDGHIAWKMLHNPGKSVRYVVYADEERKRVTWFTSGTLLQHVTNGI